MLAPLLRLFALKDVLKVVVETAKVAAAARDVLAASRRRTHTASAQPLAGAAPDPLAGEVARLRSLVAEHAQTMEQAAAQMERLADEVKRVALRSTLALVVAIVALGAALLVAWRG
jgi:hypothetical protein